MDENRSVAIDLMRVLACVGVISIHFSMFYGTRWIIFIRPLVGISVPVFMSISGYSIFYRNNDSYKDILKRKFLRYFILFNIWRVIYLGYSWINTRPDMNLIQFVLTNSEVWHLWYLKVYLEILICFPLIKVITEKNSCRKLYIVFWVVFISIRCSLATWFHLEPYVYRIIQLPFFQYSGLISGTVKGYYPMEALGLFVLGGALVKYFEERARNRSKICPIILIMIGIFSLSCSIFVSWKWYSSSVWAYFCDPYMINMVLILMGFIAFCYMISGNCPVTIRKILAWMADKTLGVYILQGLLNSWITNGLNWVNCNNVVIRKVIVFFGVLLGGALITWFAHKYIPKKICGYLI